MYAVVEIWYGDGVGGGYVNNGQDMNKVKNKTTLKTTITKRKRGITTIVLRINQACFLVGCISRYCWCFFSRTLSCQQFPISVYSVFFTLIRITRKQYLPFRPTNFCTSYISWNNTYKTYYIENKCKKLHIKPSHFFKMCWHYLILVLDKTKWFTIKSKMIAFYINLQFTRNANSLILTCEILFPKDTIFGVSIHRKPRYYPTLMNLRKCYGLLYTHTPALSYTNVNENAPQILIHQNIVLSKQNKNSNTTLRHMHESQIDQKKESDQTK